MSSKQPSVVVLGAGLTGMSASYHLQSMGIGHRLLERAPQPGGLAITVEQSGFRFDRTGHLLHLRDPAMRSLATAWLGNEWLSIERRSMIWSHGAYTRYPFQANTLGLPAKVAYECIVGFVHALRQPHAQAPTDFEQYCLQHFGDGFSKHFMIPYNSRLWGVHPREITAEWCSRFVPLPTLEEVIAGAVGLAGPEMGYNASFLYPRKGIGALTSALAKAVGPVECGKELVALDPQRKRLTLQDGEQIDYDVLISTIPLDHLLARTEGIAEPIRQAASKLRCSSLHYLDVALDVPSAHPFHWVYVPEQRYPFYRVGVYSNFSKEMAPEGKACMYIELADRQPPILESLVPDVAAGLVEMGFIDQPNQVLFAEHRTIEHAYVIFDHAYYASVDSVHGFLKDQDILSTGRYGGWNYSSMEDALLFGQAAAHWARKSLP
ncbi:MAG TPA: FAD-dependent oxidoreductase [Polyangiaceae bacterium]|jgi:protoporphyrinogen oxidase|nr:MAG: hypothetical protein BWY17_00343 [Deltaproteobacteria bacterium ADurb.Bin207]HNS98832.1 FAD-dependent oxidoreductase [Polyangiaceae bacterium]HNZ22168.1 FAD-dependent oxidoreductase [Polyangiaceae bacterium]HOD21336.1 FAD-dependent oxidoreductase [Polyangiaceae bacterium]HOE46992.1 FAD-dependent oxidoreductase [Polyangiaceae bacterium]